MKTTKDVAEEIRVDLRYRNLMIKDVAEKIGKSQQNFANMLKGVSRFSKTTAGQLSDLFGYAPDFLTSGEGEIYGTCSAEDVRRYGPVRGFDKVQDGDGSFFPNSSSLTPRQALLNEYAVFLNECYQKASTILPPTELNHYSGSEYYLQPRDNKEKEIFQTIQLLETLLIQILNPQNIVDKLAGME